MNALLGPTQNCHSDLHILFPRAAQSSWPARHWSQTEYFVLFFFTVLYLELNFNIKGVGELYQPYIL